jgi:hypothetical protein
MVSDSNDFTRMRKWMNMVGHWKVITTTAMCMDKENCYTKQGQCCTILGRFSISLYMEAGNPLNRVLCTGWSDTSGEFKGMSF